MPIAPLKWELRPMVAHRFGRVLSLGLQIGAGRYEEGGTSAMAALKIKVKPIPSLRLSATLSAQRDVESPGDEPLLSRYLGLGVTWYL